MIARMNYEVSRGWFKLRRIYNEGLNFEGCRMKDRTIKDIQPRLIYFEGCTTIKGRTIMDVINCRTLRGRTIKIKN